MGLVWQGGNGVDDLLRNQMEMVNNIEFTFSELLKFLNESSRNTKYTRFIRFRTGSAIAGQFHQGCNSKSAAGRFLNGNIRKIC